MKEKSGKKSGPKKKKSAAADNVKASPEPKAQPEAGPRPDGKPQPNAAPPNPPKSIYEDFDMLSEYLTDVSGKSQDVIRDYFARNPNMRAMSGEMPSDPLNVGEAFQEMLKSLSVDPGTVMQRQFNLWGDYAKLMANMQRRIAGEEIKPAILPDQGD